MKNNVLTQFDIDQIRNEFPILQQKINGNPLIYFDNAATSQKPRQVIQALTQYYTEYNANIHRGIHTLAEKATKAFEESRATAKSFIHASSVEEIIFVKGVTEGINLVASSFGETFIQKGDEILISAMEHHSNLVPWQRLCEKTGASLNIIPIQEDGEIILDSFYKLVNARTKMVAINHASNSLGTVNPIKTIIDYAHQWNAAVLIDGAQAGAHLPIDVQALDCDFYCLSSHKMYGPTGTGILFGKKVWLEKMPPYQGGGEMIKDVSFQKTSYNDLPYKFEAGTPNIADVIAFKAALDFITRLGKENIARHEDQLLEYATQQISKIPGVRIIGKAKEKVGVLSFVVDGIHPFDLGQMLDSRGIAVRTGHHCTQPLMDMWGLEGTVRASFAVYNTFHEIDQLADALTRIINFLKTK